MFCNKISIPLLSKEAAMLNIPKIPRVTLLIDADNVQLTYIKDILNIAKCYGSLTICRAYGDWQKSPLSAWHKAMLTHNITPIQQDRIVKNATDYRLMIESGEILGFDKADVFIIASGDGDFTILCQRIKATGKQVIGIGNRKQTSQDFRKSCNKFIYIENLNKELDEPCEFRMLVEGVIRQLPQKDGGVNYGQLVNKLRDVDPNFESRLGIKKLSKWLQAYPHIFKIQQNYVSLV
jgi:hypothetical protein